MFILDPCVLDKSLKSYPDEDVRNCRTFWECQNGVSKPKCCPPGQMFDRKLVTCIHDPQETCRSPCPLKIGKYVNIIKINLQFVFGIPYWDPDWSILPLGYKTTNNMRAFLLFYKYFINWVKQCCKFSDMSLPPSRWQKGK